MIVMILLGITKIEFMNVGVGPHLAVILTYRII